MRDGTPRRARVRPRAIAGLAALCLCLPATASAEGEVTGPTPASLAAGKPAFNVTNTPSLIVLSIRLSRTSAINSVGELDGAGSAEEGATIDVDNDVRPSTTVQGTDDFMFAGRYFWQYALRPVNPDGTTGDHFFSATQPPFKVPGFVRKLSMKAPYQDPRGTQFGVTGYVYTNARKAPYECVIRRGAAVVARKRNYVLPISAGHRDTWECLDMKVPESNDGKALKLTVTVTGGAQKLTISRTFIGR
jgi:hypothetical protein